MAFRAAGLPIEELPGHAVAAAAAAAQDLVVANLRSRVLPGTCEGQNVELSVTRSGESFSFGRLLKDVGALIFPPILGAILLLAHPRSLLRTQSEYPGNKSSWSFPHRGEKVGH